MRLVSDSKITAFRKGMASKGIETAVFFSSEPIYDANIEYFTGFRQERGHAFACLLVEEDTASLVVSNLEYDRACKEVDGFEILNRKDFDNSLIKVLRKRLRGKRTIGVNEGLFPYILYRKFRSRKFKDVSEMAYNLRAVKEPKEIEILKKAAAITNHGIKVIREGVTEGMAERELSLALEQEMIRKGADGFSFPPIVKSGESSAYIHPYPNVSDRKIGRGLGLVDFGILYKGYCSDMTVPLRVGKLTAKELLIAETVEEAYQESVDALRVGEAAWRVFNVADEVIKGAGFELKHSLGHGIGLEVHESPNLSPKPKKKKDLKRWREERLEDGMVFTIEPGIYEPGTGGYRLENDILLKKNGAEVLTGSKPIKTRGD
jgi:Xaa-Pro aminopeptidase